MTATETDVIKATSLTIEVDSDKVEQFNKIFEELCFPKYFRWLQDNGVSRAKLFFPKVLRGVEQRKLKSLLNKIGDRINYSWSIDFEEKEHTENVYNGIDVLDYVKKNYGEYYEVESVKTFNEKTILTVQKPVLEVSEKKKVGESTVFKPVYKIYEALIGAGTSPIYIIVDGSRKLDLGIQKLVIRPLLTHKLFAYPPTEYRYKTGVHEIARKFGVSVKDVGLQTIWEDLFEKHDKETIFYELALPASIEEVLKLSDVKEVIYTGISGGDLDPYILLAFSGWSICPLPGYVGHRIAMKYNPHGVVIANTKIGKSVTASKTGKTIERPKIANLTGFSTAKETVEGYLNKQHETVFIDEFQQQSEEEAYGSGLLSLKESGETYIARGRGVYCETHSTIVYLGNPVEDIKLNYLYEFDKNVRKITNNFQAFGSRIGLILFGDFKPHKKDSSLTDGLAERYEYVLQTIREILSIIYSVCLTDSEISAWLNKPIEEYSQQIDEIREEIVDSSVSEFLKGQKDAYQHIRGMALRLAIIDLADKLFSSLRKLTPSALKDPDKIGELVSEHSEELLNISDRKLELVTSINLESYRRISNIIMEEDYGVNRFRLQYESAPKYIQIFLKAVIKHYSEHKRDTIALEELKDYVKQFIEQGTKYDSTNRVINPIEKQYEKKINPVFDFIKIIDVNKMLLVKVTDNELLETDLNIGLTDLNIVENRPNENPSDNSISEKKEGEEELIIDTDQTDQTDQGGENHNENHKIGENDSPQNTQREDRSVRSVRDSFSGVNKNNGGSNPKNKDSGENLNRSVLTDQMTDQNYTIKNHKPIKDNQPRMCDLCGVEDTKSKAQFELSNGTISIAHPDCASDSFDYRVEEAGSDDGSKENLEEEYFDEFGNKVIDFSNYIIDDDSCFDTT